MPVQLIIFLLLFGGLQGLLLSFFFIRKKLFSHGYIFLLLYFGVMLLQVTLKIMSKSWLIQHWQFLYTVSYFLPLLYGPLIFLFARQLLLNRRFHKTDILHFLPFGLLFFGLLSQKMFSFPGTGIYFFYRINTGIVMQCVSLLIYHGLALQCRQQYINSLKNYFSETERLRMNWIRQFIVASLVVCTIIATAIYLLYMNYPRGTEFRYGFAALTIFIYWISYTALAQPAVFSVIKGQGKEEGMVTPLLTKLVAHHPRKKYAGSALSGEASLSIRLALQKTMQERKPYLDPALTINDLAALVKCNRHHLSQVLNESMKMSFYDYVNYCRVEEAKQLLHDPLRAGHKIASVAYDAGFNSLSAFNDVFRKMNGQTPSQYRKQKTAVSERQRV